MPDLQTYLQYNNPNIVVWREGSANDPYLPRVDPLPVINGMITLLEIPSETHKVQIAGLTEVDRNLFLEKKTLEAHEFFVDYANGIVMFQPSHEGRTYSCSYHGRGVILLGASRVYAMVSRSPDVVKTLQEIIDEMMRRLQETNEAIQHLEQVIKQAAQATNQANQASDNANQAADDAKLATEKALYAYNTTILVFKPPVADMKELLNAYPYPQVGWTVQTYKDGMRYRFDGKDWIPIDIFGENIQLVSEFNDGLMSIAEHLKLKSIPLEVKDRVIVFHLPSYVVYGAQDVIAKFPFDGEIIGVDAICGDYGLTETEIALEKSTNLVDWYNVLSQNIYFKPYEYFDDKSAAVSRSKVKAGDMFRLNIVKQGAEIQNITLEVIIKI
ncbi:hypothetical protein PAE9249_05130 [Paenibacillus sp. CECT 9249]|uniref:hypothetical protein n=1 Tax=Paenibacillus sp. CECT 9249 TaxID=2845385 RepID=UPI001E623A1B|nr:hypothetical protein [Paenibacillus sp. CECT 9249]CAH0122558.1 hypothetical protein PAE9249_05130 [Paenibacillus sp. CECT 9249]